MMNADNKEINNLYAFKDPENGKYGFRDYLKRCVINAQFDWAKDFSEEFAVIEINHKYGFIDKTGKIVISPQFDRAESFSNGLAKVNIGAKWKREGKWGFIDKTGRVICKPRFDYIGDFSEGLSPVKTGGKCGYIDKNGDTVIKPQFAHEDEFTEGLAPAQKVKFPGLFGGNYFARVVSAVSRFYGEGEVELCDLFGGKYGYIDKSGKFVIKRQFNWAGCFSEGLALVEVGRKWGRTHGKFGFIDKTGKFAINPVFDYAGTFHNGRAIVKWHMLTNEYQKYDGIIDKTGKIVVNTRKVPAGTEMDLDGFLSEWTNLLYKADIRFSEGLAPIDVGGVLFQHILDKLVKI